ncbi:excinuclease ABC subunit UvrA [Agreia sp. VKM Ac-1783]|uniref:excinuclease ABC subunit UvrA n=1 Tax=Agreia sp. VKM Ac-1783 TaxID=1938889 RepID=UPI000A2ABD11|nr:excinuclease ABC subunit UvrA [Agreia sp. VKM Ac-1783]SMQ67517.1 Excinuclease ABC subunit A [Agreia sp. VKM Ac-1783]
MSTIKVRGARAHNLRDVDVDIPRGSLTVFSGLSGSGKSSLAFDTIFAEGQRRYVESLSSYARMFLDQVDRPDVDLIEGLSPAVSIDQKTTSRNPRSTVGTITEIYDYLRLLWARAGIPHCPTCGEVVGSQTVQQIADQLMELDDGTRFQILAPVVTARKGEFVDLFAELTQSGYSRAVIDGDLVQLSEQPKLRKQIKHDIAVVVDRMIAGRDMLSRLTDSLETALRLADGNVLIDFVGVEGSAGERLFSERMSCPQQHPVQLTEQEPRTFSFNAPFGACSACTGLGSRLAVDTYLILGDPVLSIAEGVILPWAQSGGPSSRYFHQLLTAVADDLDFSLETPWRELSEEVQQAVLNGNDFEVTVQYKNRWGRQVQYSTGFEGVVPYIERKHAEAESDAARDRHGRYLREVPCSVCQGRRLKPEVLAVTVSGLSIADATELSIEKAATFFMSLELTSQQADIAVAIVREISARLEFLLSVGLSYLSLSRGSGTLSGGEAQRIRLDTQVGSGLTGVLYVLDEPSIGLHQRDNARLIETLKRLQRLGNTLIVVEHDEDTLRTADWIVDIGPGAGTEGGRVVYSGPVPGLLDVSDSITADYLAGRRSIPVPARRRPIDEHRILRIEGAREHTLKNLSVNLPLGVLTAVTGVSGSGKSTLINDILYKTLANKLNHAQHAPGRHTRITGLEHLDKVVHVDQAPIGRTPRSNPATYTGVFDRIRQLFADTPEAKIRGYQAGRFSFNIKGGRCEACKGDGTITIEMNFLPDVHVDCEVCQGTRYNRDTLHVHYKGRSIAEVLRMPIVEAAEFFGAFTIISRYLDALVGVGLGYVQLGQAATTLSGGETQRVKLATELQRRTRGRNIYILDEPTTGLHFDDVRRLVDVIDKLVDQGNTVVVIEHNLDVIKRADWVIDLGPEGGDAGGTVVATGTPEQITTTPSWTGQYLVPLIATEKQKVNESRRSPAMASRGDQGRHPEMSAVDLT